jgi:hypothetical protein
MQWVATKVAFCISRIAAFGAGFLILVLAIGPWPFDRKKQLADSNWQLANANPSPKRILAANQYQRKFADCHLLTANCRLAT